MGSLWRALGLGLGRGRAPVAHTFDGFIDQLLQKFEDSRPGLTPAMIADPAAAEAFFRELYEREVPRLAAAIQTECPHLGAERLRQLQGEVDDHVRRVLVPAYARLGSRFTRAERNDFYLLPEGTHGLERALAALCGMAVGGFVVWAPFIPLTAKEWVLPFALGGLLFPEIRRWLANRGYEGEVNRLVGRSDRELERLQFAYLTHGNQPSGLAPGPVIDVETEPVPDRPGTRRKVEEGR